MKKRKAKISPDLEKLVRPIAELSLDPQNARSHTKKSLAPLKASLRVFGQRKPIVAYKGKVIAGNGTYMAAYALGWDKIAVTEFEGTPLEARAYSIADNRTAELSKWDKENLARGLNELAEEWDDFDSGALGFDDNQLSKMAIDHGEAEAAENGDIDAQYLIHITCTDEAQQNELLERFLAEGLEVRALVS